MSEPSKSKLDSRWLWVPAILLLIAVFVVVRRITRPQLPVRVARVARHDLTKPDSTNGRVEPQHNYEAHAPAPGIVKRLYVHAGEQVKAGELLLSLDDADAVSRVATALTAVRGAQANLDAIRAGGTQEEQLNLSNNLAKAQVDVDTAQKNLATLQQLQAQGSASASEVTSARQTYNAAELNLQSLQKRKTDRYAKGDVVHAESSLTDAKASYQAAQAVVEQSNVRAPFAGTVYSLPVSQTEFVQQGQLLLQMADLTRLQVRAYFDEPDIGALAVGQEASIQWDAKPAHLWSGRVIALPSTIISYTTRNVGETLISIDPSDQTLPPNANVTVKVTTQDVRDVLSVPRDAVHREGGIDYVFLVHGNSIRRKDVKTGAINLAYEQILSGLNEGDEVALGTTNGEPLAEGVPIRVIQ
jgi:HlyD family secretion protein